MVVQGLPNILNPRKALIKALLQDNLCCTLHIVKKLAAVLVHAAAANSCCCALLLQMACVGNTNSALQLECLVYLYSSFEAKIYYRHRK